jgi:hypothetical protein
LITGVVGVILLVCKTGSSDMGSFSLRNKK